MKKKQYKILTLILAIILCCFFSTIAYSAVYSTMNITGIAYARVVKDVRITDFKINSSSDVTSSYEEFSVNTISSKFNLVDSSSFITFDVEVTNYGASDVGILQLIGDVPTGLSYEIINYNLKDKICDDNGKCNQMAVKTFQIKFTGTPGEYEITQELDFRTYHKVTYTGITNNNYPTKVIDGGNLNITFTENLKRISVLSTGTEINYYPYISNGDVISIDTISGNIEIKKLEPVAKLVSGEINESGGEVCIGNECFYIIGNDGSKVTMLAKHNLYVGSEFDWAAESLTNYGSSATGIQSPTMLGYDEASSTFKGVTAFSNSGTAYSGSIVEGYVNSYMDYLNSLGGEVTNARLITYDELIENGCDDIIMSCSDGLSFLTTSTYWTMSAVDSEYVWIVDTIGYFGYTGYGSNNSAGVRPVIEIALSDISYTPPVMRMLSGDYDTVGSEAVIGDEHFYVISSDDTTVTMLAKYNLHVGNTYDAENGVVPLNNPTGIQELTAKGWFYNYSVSNPIIGVKPFASTNYWSNISSYPSYVYNQNSYLYGYVNNYKGYLEGLGVTIKEGRLITLEELISLGCVPSSNSCGGAPNWVYSSTYWSGSAETNNKVWYVASNSNSYATTYSNNIYGVRPVIIVNKKDFKNIKKVSVGGGTPYRYYDGMTWGEWVDSKYNTTGYVRNTVKGVNGLTIWNNYLAYNDDASVVSVDDVIDNTIEYGIFYDESIVVSE